LLFSEIDSPLTRAAMHDYAIAIGAAGVMELKLRMSANHVPALSADVHAIEANRVYDAVFAAFAQHLSVADRAFLESARTLRNKLAHANFPAVRERLRALGYSAPANVVRGLFSTGDVREVQALDQAQPELFGWLLEARSTGLLLACYGVFVKAIRIIDGLVVHAGEADFVASPYEPANRSAHLRVPLATLTRHRLESFAVREGGSVETWVGEFLESAVTALTGAHTCSRPAAAFHRSEIEAIVRDAVARVEDEDAALRDLGCTERALSHRLAVYLGEDERLVGWHVDCEYNRDANDAKVLAGYNGENGVYIDVVVHKRGACENLIAIECKLAGARHSNGANRERDRNKLRQLRVDSRYAYAFTASVCFWGVGEERLDLVGRADDETSGASS